MKFYPLICHTGLCKISINSKFCLKFGFLLLLLCGYFVLLGIKYDDKKVFATIFVIASKCEFRLIVIPIKSLFMSSQTNINANATIQKSPTIFCRVFRALCKTIITSLSNPRSLFIIPRKMRFACLPQIPVKLL